MRKYFNHSFTHLRIFTMPDGEWYSNKSKNKLRRLTPVDRDYDILRPIYMCVRYLSWTRGLFVAQSVSLIILIHVNKLDNPGKLLLMLGTLYSSSEKSKYNEHVYI